MSDFDFGSVKSFEYKSVFQSSWSCPLQTVMESFTEAEINALTQFKKRIGDLLKDDFSKRNENLIRWLRARDLDVNKAEDMMRKSMKWRQDNKLDSILSEPEDDYMEKTYPYFMDGIDRQGRLVWTMPFGAWDFRKTVEEDGPERICRHMLRMLEKMTKKLREHVEAAENESRAMRFTVVNSMAGFSFRQLANMKSVNTILQQVSIFETHYPEILDTVNAVDAPAVFTTLFNMMKPLLSARTLSKVSINGCNREQWEPKVLAIVSPEQIRPEYGGTKQ